MLRLLLGLIATFLMIGMVFYFFLFANPIGIHEPNLLNWIPALAVILGFGISGWINRKLKYKYLPILLLPLVILKPFGYIYFPLIVILDLIAISALLLTRDTINTNWKRGGGTFLLLSFIYLLFSQALILEKSGFDYDEDGALVNAVTLWDFNSLKNDVLPSHVLLTEDNTTVDIEDIGKEVCLISFWATWCAPCIENKPALEQLKAELANEKIKFVDITFDSDIETWRQYIIDHDPKGLQLRSRDQHATGRQLGFAGIPMYIIVDKDGSYRKIRSFESARDLIKGVN